MSSLDVELSKQAVLFEAKRKKIMIDIFKGGHGNVELTQREKDEALEEQESQKQKAVAKLIEPSQPKSRDGDILKRERSAFAFGRAYQAAVNRGALIEPMSASGRKTAPKQIQIALETLGLELSETKITALVKSLLND